MPGTKDRTPRDDDNAATIRRPTSTDLPGLVAMISQLADHHGDRATVTTTQLADMLFATPPWATALIAEDAGGPAGYAILCRVAMAQFGQRGLDLHHLFVHPGLRSRGLGERIVHVAMADAAAQGCRYMTVGTHPDNLRAQAFYVRLGFEPTSPTGTRFWRSIGDADGMARSR